MNPLKVYASYNVHDDIRLNSSSGAIFSLLAEYVFDRQGIVYGVAMAEDCYSAEFIEISDRKDLVKLQGSKYMQAKIGDTFKQVKKALMKEKLVLFTGTGCQINGLKSFLGKEYANLICVDVICHGVPSTALWKKYVEYQEKNFNGKLKEIRFRCKNDSWTDFKMEEVLNKKLKGVTKKIYISKDKDPYMQMFLKDYCLRPSCYKCTAKKMKKSDITIADFWGIENIAPEMNDGMGTSLVLVRTAKGLSIFENLEKEMKFKEVSYEDGIKGNPAEYKSCVKPPERETFFEDMRNMSFLKLKKKYLYVSPFRRVVRKIKTFKHLFGNGGGKV